VTGPQHYREAEHILDHAEENALEHSSEWYANAVAAAQVHATLALAAATAEQHATEWTGTPAGREWAAAIS